MDQTIAFGGRPVPGPAAHPWLARSCGAERSSVADVLDLMGAHAAIDANAWALPLTMRQLHVGETLFHECTKANTVYFVHAGTFKTFLTAEDGYEQVLDFVGRAELLGFDALCSGEHPSSAVALETSSVLAVPMLDLVELGCRVPAFGAVVHRAVSSTLARRSELAEMMAAVAAEVRLARFLVQLSRRMAAQGQSPRRFRLRMSRREIASLLGVAHETVSRSFGALVLQGLIDIDQREVEIVDVDALKTFARSTRRTVGADAMPMAVECDA